MVDERIKNILSEKNEVMKKRKGDLIREKIARRYSYADELAIQRRKDVRPQEFEEYNAYCEDCIAEAEAELLQSDEN